MWQTVVVCFGVIAAVSGFSATGPVSQCVNNPGAFPVEARVAGCAAAPCELHQLDYVDMDISFRAPRDSAFLFTEVTAYINLLGISLPVPFYLGEKSATCNYLKNLSCPVREDDLLVYTLSLLIEAPFPENFEAAMEVSIRDDAYAAVACLRVPFVALPPRK